MARVTLKCNLIFFTLVRSGIEYWHPVYLHILNFRRLPKIAKSDNCIRHVSPAVYKHGKTGLAVQGFPRNLIFYYFSKMFRKYLSCINYGKNNGLLHEAQNTFGIISRSFSDKSFRGYQNPHFALNNFFRTSWFYEIKLKNTAESGRSQMTIWCVRVALWIPKVKRTYSEYVILLLNCNQNFTKQDRYYAISALSIGLSISAKGDY
jgi:hypothetical protein